MQDLQKYHVQNEIFAADNYEYGHMTTNELVFWIFQQICRVVSVEIRDSTSSYKTKLPYATSFFNDHTLRSFCVGFFQRHE
ncbi:hypothetical protein RB195_009162 [Necator americanus]|uniref:Uncharacterized protein n=1 Tax=Necator americanus TaxID=51031 RepID=A0ABR1CUL4_NECAM